MKERAFDEDTAEDEVARGLTVRGRARERLRRDYVKTLYPTLEQYGLVGIKDGAVVPGGGVVPYDLDKPLCRDLRRD